MITVLTGGTGGAKLVDGLRRVVAPEDLTIIVNTGDDFEWWGLHISPDVDSIAYVLAGLLSRERGWGVQGDTFFCLQSMSRMGLPAWFQIGDRDLATHLARTQFLREGKTLTEATAEIASRLGIKSRILPMSDAKVETMVGIEGGEISFQEYFVRRRYRDAVKSVRFAGAEHAKPGPGVIKAIQSAATVLLAPSNPVTSIGPILAVPGVRDALRSTSARVLAVSPIVGQAAVTGPAAALMAMQGFKISIAGISETYSDFLAGLIVDRQDTAEAEALRRTGMEVHCAQTIMKTDEDRIELARAVLACAAGTPAARFA